MELGGSISGAGGVSRSRAGLLSIPKRKWWKSKNFHHSTNRLALISYHTAVARASFLPGYAPHPILQMERSQ